MPHPQAWAAPDLSADPGVPADPATSPYAVGTPGASAPGASAPGSAEPVRTVINRSELLGGDIPLRPLGVSETLDAAITGIRRSPRAVLGLSLIIATAGQVMVSLVAYFFIGDTYRSGVTPALLMHAIGGQWLLGTISLLLTAYAVLVLAGLLGPVLGRTLFGLPVSLGQAWRDARPALARLIGVATIVMAVSVGALAVPVLPLVLLVVGNGPPGLAVLAGIVGVVGGTALMVWLYVLFVLAAPAVVVERASLPDALRRARKLLQQRWWRICGVLLLTLLITVFMGNVLRVPFLLLEFLVTGVSGGHVSGVIVLGIDTLGRILSETLTSPFDAGVIALLYIDLRMRREGFDLDVQTREDTEMSGDFLAGWRPS